MADHVDPTTQCIPQVVVRTSNPDRADRLDANRVRPAGLTASSRITPSNGCRQKLPGSAIRLRGKAASAREWAPASSTRGACESVPRRSNPGSHSLQLHAFPDEITVLAAGMKR